MMQKDNSTSSSNPPPPSANVSSMLTAKLPPPPASLAGAAGVGAIPAGAGSILSQALAKPPSLSSLKLNVPPPPTFAPSATATSQSASVTPLSMLPPPPPTTSSLSTSFQSHSATASPLPGLLNNSSLNSAAPFLKQASMPAPSPTPLAAFNAGLGALPRPPGSGESSLSNSFSNLNGPSPTTIATGATLGLNSANSLASSQNSGLNASLNSAPESAASSLFNNQTNLSASLPPASTAQLFQAPQQSQPPTTTSSLFPAAQPALNNGVHTPSLPPVSNQQPQQLQNMFPRPPVEQQQQSPLNNFPSPLQPFNPPQQQQQQPSTLPAFNQAGVGRSFQPQPLAPFTAPPATGTAPPTNMFAPPPAAGPGFSSSSAGATPMSGGPPPQFFNPSALGQAPVNAGPPTGPPSVYNTNGQGLANGRVSGPPPPLAGPPQVQNMAHAPSSSLSGPPMMGPPPSGPPLAGQPALNAAYTPQPASQQAPPAANLGYNGPPGQYQPYSSQMAPPPAAGIAPPPQGPPQQPAQLANQFNKMSLGAPQQPQMNQQHSPNNQYNNFNQQYPQQQQQQYKASSPFGGSVDLFREKRLIMPYSGESDSEDEQIRPKFPHDFYTNVNCSSDIVRCTLTAIPESQALLNKIRLPLGILIHPFKDLESLKVVQSSTIVRCRNCRSYINPFVSIIDNSKWRCNLCYSINELPDEFLFDPVTRTYGDPSKRPEINSSTIEFIAPAEYTLRPPPPAMYLYLLDVSHNAVATGYLSSFCETLLENIEKIPGDTRTQIGFITYASSVHFYSISEAYAQAKMMIYPDIEDMILPLPDQLMANLSENKEAIRTFLQQLPDMFVNAYETDSALGTALNAAHQLLKPTGGRITVMQTCLPNLGVGALKVREESVDKDSSNMAPQTDFYKKLALECAGVHIAIDMFMFNTLYSDLATLSCAPKYSGGELKYYPGFHIDRHPEQVVRFCVDFKRYITRKIGLEAVMRVRCSRGLAIHTFHGNFFVRSTDLLALPNVNPDAGFGMQVAIEEPLSDTPTVSFQAAILYTSSKGERRIRIHTYCLPVSKSAGDLMNGADQEAIIGLVAKMAVDRTSMNSLKEAKDAMFNVGVDYLQAFSQILTSANKTALMSPYSLRLIPLYLLALMKNIAFKFGSNVRLDDRIYAMNVMKTMPLKYLMLSVYPNLYSIHNLDDKKVVVESDAEICIPPRLHLSSENIDRHGVYVMDCGEAIYMWIGRSVSDDFLRQVFDVKSFQELPDNSNDLPELDNVMSERVRNFLVYLYDSRSFGPTFMYFREDSKKSQLFFQHMYDDKSESSLSYYEFLRSLSDQVNS